MSTDLAADLSGSYSIDPATAGLGSWLVTP